MGLIGMELTFFIIARVVLCFRFVTKKIITPMFQLPLNNACIVSRPPLSLILSIPESRLRVGKRLGGGLSWDSWPSCPKGYSITYNAMLSNKRVGRVGEAGGMVVVVPKVAVAWRLAGHHSPDGCGKWLPLPHLCCFSFLALLNGLYFGPWFFSHVFPSDSLPHQLLGGRERAIGWELTCQPQSTNHNAEAKHIRITMKWEGNLQCASHSCAKEQEFTSVQKHISL